MVFQILAFRFIKFNKMILMFSFNLQVVVMHIVLITISQNWLAFGKVHHICMKSAFLR